jgi:putative ABC transport system permease protein
MVIGVLERRTEIGLRRALGAARRPVAAQFLGEAFLLGALRGCAGVAIGFAVTAGLAATRSWQVLIPPIAVWGGLGVAVAIGGVAGVWPALRASRLSPTDALRSV